MLLPLFLRITNHKYVFYRKMNSSWLPGITLVCSILNRKRNENKRFPFPKGSLTFLMRCLKGFNSRIWESVSKEQDGAQQNIISNYITWKINGKTTKTIIGDDHLLKGFKWKKKNIQEGSRYSWITWMFFYIIYSTLF